VCPSHTTGRRRMNVDLLMILMLLVLVIATAAYVAGLSKL
jgi:hypothetical protein